MATAIAKAEGENDMKDLTTPLEIALNRLRQHIGLRRPSAPGWTPGHPEEFFAEWTRQLAGVVKRHTIPHTIPQLHAYAGDVRVWAGVIEISRTADILEEVRAIHLRIKETDCTDGWPEDRAGNTLYHVCLGAMFSLDPRHAEHSRWPDEASCKVWEYVTGASAFNEVVDVSRTAWQRHLWAQTLGAMSAGKGVAE